MSSTAPPLLGILVVNYGCHRLLLRNLVHLVEAAPNAFAVVIDNYTTDAERQQIRALALVHGWHLKTPDRNLGFGGGMNMAAAMALDLGAQHILLLNPDVSLEPETLAVLREDVTAHPSAMVSPTVVRPDGSIFFQGIDLCLRDGRMRSRRRRPAGGSGRRKLEIRPWLSGACLILHGQLWQTSGGFDDDFFLYWEDVDLSHRIEDAGGVLRLLPDAMAVHDEGATSRHAQVTSRARSDTYYYYNIRNRLLYARKHLGWQGRLRWVAFSPIVALEIVLQGGRRQFLHSGQPVRTAVRATIDGLSVLVGLRRAGERHG